jgi:nitrogen fixation protein NifB
MSTNYEKLARMHPCYAQGPAAKTGRIHLPVCPGCNIRCKFCSQEINHTKQAPGVASEILTPAQALDVVEKSVELCPQIAVVGIAGPGDTLATNRAFETFALVDAKFPQLLKCMSTNGLLLAKRAQEVIDAKIDSLTVTVNAVDPQIEAQINECVHFEGQVLYGEEAAAVLIENQLAGIAAVAAAGVTVKVNAVLIPGVNDAHIATIARTVSAAGAKIMNIIPLIPQAKMAHIAAPTCAQIDSARVSAEPFVDVFRHCQHCRADAIGIPGGRDYGEQIYLKRASTAKQTFSHG